MKNIFEQYLKKINESVEEPSEEEFDAPKKGEFKQQYIDRRVSEFSLSPEHEKLLSPETKKRIMIDLHKFYADLYDEYKNNKEVKI